MDCGDYQGVGVWLVWQVQVVVEYVGDGNEMAPHNHVCVSTHVIM